MPVPPPALSYLGSDCSPVRSAASLNRCTPPFSPARQRAPSDGPRSLALLYRRPFACTPAAPADSSDPTARRLLRPSSPPGVRLPSRSFSPHRFPLDPQHSLLA